MTQAARPTNRCQNLRTKFCVSPGRRPAQCKAKPSRLHCTALHHRTRCLETNPRQAVCHASVQKSVHLGPACLGLDRVQAGSQWHPMSEGQCSERSRCTDCDVLTGVIYAESAEPDFDRTREKRTRRNAMEQLRATTPWNTRNTLASRVVDGWPCRTAH